MKFYCIADEDTVRGFRLAGVPGKVALTAEEATTALQAATQGDVGIIVLTQNVAAQIRQRVDEFRRECDRPLLVEIPGPDGAVAGGQSLRQIVHAAVGIRLDNQGS